MSSLEEMRRKNQELRAALEQQQRQQQEAERLRREHAEMQELMRQNAELQLLLDPGAAAPRAAYAAPAPAPVVPPTFAAAAVPPAPAYSTSAEDREIAELKKKLADLHAVAARGAAPAPAPSAPAAAPVDSKAETIRRLEAERKKLEAEVAAKTASKKVAEDRTKADTVARMEAENRRLREELDAKATKKAEEAKKADTVARMAEENKRLLEALATKKATEEKAKFDTVARMEAENRKLKDELEGKKAATARATALKAEFDKMKTHLVDIAKNVTSIDLVIVMDCTGSMSSWMNEAKTKLLDIVADVQKNFPSVNLRVGFVGYRDYCDGANRLVQQDLTPDAAAVRNLISAQSASGGGDEPEDVAGGINAAASFGWQAGTRVIVHVGDAPAHGNQYNNCGSGDSHAGGDPAGLRLEDLMQRLASQGVDYVFFKVNASTDKMLAIMAAAYRDDQSLRELVVENLGSNVALFSERIMKSVRDSVTKSATRSRMGISAPRTGPAVPSFGGAPMAITPSVAARMTTPYFEPHGPLAAVHE